MPSESTNWMIGPRQNLNVKVWQLIARKILSRDLERSALKGPGKRKETSSDRLSPFPDSSSISEASGVTVAWLNVEQSAPTAFDQ